MSGTGRGPKCHDKASKLHKQRLVPRRPDDCNSAIVQFSKYEYLDSYHADNGWEEEVRAVPISSYTIAPCYNFFRSEVVPRPRVIKSYFHNGDTEQNSRALKSPHQRRNKPLVLTNVWDILSARAVAELLTSEALATASFKIAHAAGLVTMN
jgi:hypothetical protein